MGSAQRPWLGVVVLGIFSSSILAQQPQAPPPVPPPSSPPVQLPTGNAATVNGQAIAEKAIFRSLQRVPADKRAEARAEVINYLIDNVVIDQEMVRQNVAVDNKEIDARLDQIRKEMKKENKDFDKVMKELFLTEAELRAQIAADLRWDKFGGKQASDKALRELFEKHPAIFNGSMVHARHILVTPHNTKGGLTADQAKAKLALIKKKIDDQVAQGMAKRDPKTDNLKREEARTKLLDAAFAEAAKESDCPSRARGGDIGWFPRAGKMVEPFAQAAFALKPYQLSDIVTTPFGHHLILVLETKPGQVVKFEDIKDVVEDVFKDRLRDDLLTKLRPAAKIVINPPPKP
jgi:parvulin-like peptidyl-prolyl isomerase